MGEGTLVVQADGVRRYQYNPRLQEIMREIPKGTIYDRNGLPLATSNWDELEKHRAEYKQLGIDIDRACPRTESRHYPLRRPDVRPAGRSAHAHRAGAPATRRSWSAIPRAGCAATTTGPRWWKCKNPQTGDGARRSATTTASWCRCCAIATSRTHPEVRRVLDRPRDVRMSHRRAPASESGRDPAQPAAGG